MQAHNLSLHTHDQPVGWVKRYSSYKKKRKPLKYFLMVKIIDFQNDSISELCPSIKTFKPEFRQRYDFEIRFGIENLKS